MALAKPMRAASAAAALVAAASVCTAGLIGPGFTENLGQWSARARYRATLAAGEGDGRALDLWLTGDGYVYVLSEAGVRAGAVAGARVDRAAPLPVPVEDGATARRFHAVSLRWVGGARQAPVPSRPAPGVANWLIDGPERAVRGVRTFATVTYPGVYPGIDVRFDVLDGGRRLETSYLVAPGADPRRIAIAVEGADAVSVDGTGALLIATTLGTVRESPPTALQPGERGRTVAIPASWAVEDGQVRLAVPAHDPRRPLLIDPVVTFSRRFGGTSGEYVTAMREDATGRYVAGTTYSTDLPAESGALPSAPGSTDWFVVKFGTAGDAPLWATYVGSSASDVGVDLELLPNGDLVLAGTSESVGGFGGATPTVPANTTPGSGGRAVIAELNGTGSALVRVARFGGSGGANVAGLARNRATGEYYLLGQATAACAIPGGCGLGPAGGAQPTTATVPDGFVTRLAPDLSAASAFTFVGGAGADGLGDGVVGGEGSVYAAGFTSSSSFPLPVNRIGPGGGTDLIVAKLSADLSAANYLAVVGGARNDGGVSTSYTDLLFGPMSWRPIAVDQGGRAWLVAATASVDYPTGGAPFQPASGGNYDLVVSRLDPGGTALECGSYLGGASTDIGRSIALDDDGNVVVAGATASPDFPVTLSAIQPHNAGNYDMTVSILAPDLSGLLYGTYWGGGSTDWGVALALGPGPGRVRVAGDTYPSSPPFPAVPAGASVFGPGRSYDGAVMGLDAGGVDLAVAKTGVFTRPARWRLVVTNLGVGSATFAGGDVILLDELPDASYGQPVVEEAVNVSNGGDIVCSVAGGDLTCAAGGAPVTMAGNASFAVVVPFEPTASGTISNPRQGGRCEVDPGEVVAGDTDRSNNLAAPAAGAVTAVTVPALGGWGLLALAGLMSAFAVRLLVPPAWPRA